MWDYIKSFFFETVSMAPTIHICDPSSAWTKSGSSTATIISVDGSPPILLVLYSCLKLSAIVFLKFDKIFNNVL